MEKKNLSGKALLTAQVLASSASKKKEELSESHPINVVQMVRGDITAHVMEFQHKKDVPSHPDDFAEKLHAHLTEKKIVSASQLCIYMFVCHEIKMTHNWLACSDTKVAERLADMIDDAVVANQTVIELLKGTKSAKSRVIVVTVSEDKISTSVLSHIVDLTHLIGMLTAF